MASPTYTGSISNASGLRKNLFSTPNSSNDSTREKEANDRGFEFQSELSFEAGVIDSKNAQIMALHAQRLDKLKGLLVEIESTDWQFEPIEKLIGLQ